MVDYIQIRQVLLQKCPLYGLLMDKGGPKIEKLPPTPISSEEIFILKLSAIVESSFIGKRRHGSIFWPGFMPIACHGDRLGCGL